MHRAGIAVPILCLAVGVSALAGCATASPVDGSRGPETRGPAAEKGSGSTLDAGGSASGTIGKFTRWRAMEHVRYLTNTIGPRVRARRRESRATAYVERELTALGYRVYVQRFSVDGRTSRNVVARWPGGLRYPVIVGAHMDTVRRSPGANDNASGVAVMIEVARLFAGKSHARYVRFVAFGAEEYGTDGTHHRGSTAFVRRLGSEGRRKLAGMVSVDMVADGRPLLVGTAGIGPRVVAKTLHRKVTAAGVRARLVTTCDCSDNGPFERAGIPASFVWSAFEPNYHSPSDTVANMSKRDLVRSGRAVRAFVRALDADLIRRFRRY